ncbi:hypothetical protein PSCICO_00010 [Pseudomonas cichorii]|uniref:Uncharacterized protein n=1 Tax=Pseudomonas serbiensis TaxID=3064350 RepID=A0ABT9CXA4_9PSED|nr:MULTISPECIES: hypothetical protein [Pseudomonas]MDO7930131.1 hypothetical protein [Pseudomonas sp. KFB-138]GFM84602.1 hypothetical protein PSCICO_00010 [Pseudomonas cichorii]
MDEKQKKLRAQLARLSSAQAAEQLINMYPLESMDFGEALLLIPHLSWKQSDQKKLARHFFKKLPFASARGYEAFSSIMSVKNMLECVRERFPMSPSDMNLLFYHLIPVLSLAAKNDRDHQLILAFLKDFDLGT